MVEMVEMVEEVVELVDKQKVELDIIQEKMVVEAIQIDGHKNQVEEEEIIRGVVEVVVHITIDIIEVVEVVQVL